MFFYGLLNFQLAIGVALWGTATWVSESRDRPVVATVSGISFALVSFFFHIFGFCFFALLIGCSELAALIQRGLGNVAARRLALARMLTVVVTLLPPLILYFASPFADVTGDLQWETPVEKLFNFFAPVSGPFSIVVASALLLTVLFWAVRGHLRVAPLGWLCMPVLLVIYLVLPFAAKGGYLIDARVPVLLGFTLFAITMPSDLNRREGALLLVALSALFLMRIGRIAQIWIGSQQDIVDVRQVLTPVTAGSRVLSVQAYPDHRGYWHLTAFAMIDHRAYWSDAFATPGQQPVVTRPPYNASSNGGEPPDNYTSLGPFADAGTSPQPGYFLTGWPDKFEYVLLLNAEHVPDLAKVLPQHLTLLNHKGIAALFRVNHQHTTPEP
jgi:hypothetical protein